ncbi:MAG: choice-of-anchor D domain-containing protein [Candidatus Acidiferrum sp.]
MSITPASFGFGNVAVGTTDSQTIQLSNTGTAALTVSQVSVTGSVFSTTGLTLPLTLNPGQASTFNAQFSPTSAGSVSGSLTITSNAPGSPATVALTGTGVAATLTLSLSSNSFSFGNVNTGSSSTQTETITNTGNTNVQITQISISGSGYSLTGAGTPVGLSAGQTLTFSVIFSPTTAGSAPGTVTITSNATGSPAQIALSGTGVTPTTYSVALTWTASTSTVAGYYVYRSTTSGTGYAKLNASSAATGLTYTDTTVQNGTTYYYVTTAVDSSGTESLYSNEAQAPIP